MTFAVHLGWHMEKVVLAGGIQMQGGSTLNIGCQYEILLAVLSGQ